MQSSGHAMDMDEPHYEEGGSVYPIQNAERVTRFSSHYGRNSSPEGGNSSYSAYNLAGPSGVRGYGDHTASMVLRTYGTWWSDMPSYAPKLGPCPNWFKSEDFIELIYPKAVFPHVIRVRETYHPGSIVRILVCNVTPKESENYPPDAIRWQVLWSGPPQKDLPAQIRIFSPELNEAQFPSRVVRLEFNSQHVDYYTELDCCQMIGRYASTEEYPAVSLEERCETRVNEPDVTEKLFQDLSLEDRVPPLDRQISTQSAEEEEEYGLENGYFDYLPMEIWFKIIGYLDFESLCTATKVSRAFFRACYDPLLYQRINLQPFWTKVNDSFLEIVEPRFHYLRSLDISWTGACNQVSPENFDRFLQSCCTRLERFRAVCSPLVNVATLIFLNSLGEQLEELDVRSCSFFFGNVQPGVTSDSHYTPEDYMSLSQPQLFLLPQLTQLQRLNLYGTDITTKNVVALIRNNPQLEHINVGSCNLDGTIVSVAIGACCKKLKSLDLWRSIKFSPQALIALANGCPELLELDLGWLRFDCQAENCLVQLAQKCPRLTKLFLTAVRSQRDAELTALANNCPDLQQLDLLGCGKVSPGAVLHLLSQCHTMRFLDVSFCSNITDCDVGLWREKYPNVSIKKSFS